MHLIGKCRSTNGHWGADFIAWHPGMPADLLGIIGAARAKARGEG